MCSASDPVWQVLCRGGLAAAVDEGDEGDFGVGPAQPTGPVPTIVPPTTTQDHCCCGYIFPRLKCWCQREVQALETVPSHRLNPVESMGILAQATQRPSPAPLPPCRALH